MQAICVFCSSRNEIHPEYFTAAREVGHELGRRRLDLIYGGATVGLMGEIARSVHEHSGRVIGVIPEKLRDVEIAYTDADELIVTSGMRERKAEMAERADAFLILPGGFGTMEEAFEMITQQHLGYQNKPVVFLDTNDFFTPLKTLFDHIIGENFASKSACNYYQFVQKPAEAFAIFDNLTR